MNIKQGCATRQYHGAVMNIGTTAPPVKAPPPYPGNTIQAQATIMLHEFAHNLAIAAPFQQNDGGDQTAVEGNDWQVDHNCGMMIRNLPGITVLSRTSGGVGTSITITGVNFGSTAGSNTVTFNGVSAGITSWNQNGTSIVVSVPPNAATGNVVVTISGVPTTGPIFTVTP
jgi:hypothetical protein